MWPYLDFTCLCIENNLENFKFKVILCGYMLPNLKGP